MDLSQPKHFEFLKEVSIFCELTEKQLSLVVKHLQTKEVNENEVVFSRLEKEQVLYIIRYGELKLEMAGIEDKSFKKGEVFGEIAIINNNFRTGTIKAVESSLLLCLNGKDLFDTNKLPAEISIKIIVELAKKISSYLTNAQNTSTRSLIDQGENELVEFKSSLRYNLHTKKFDKNIEHACLKSIAAFLNTSGGTLIVCVDDKKNLLGLKEDGFRDDDHCLLHLTKLLQDHISIKHTRYIKGTIEESEGLKILRIDVKPGASPAFLTHNNTEFLYVRSGPSTTALKASEIYSFTRNRFFGKG